MPLRGKNRHCNGLPDDVPEAFRRSVAGFAFVPATPTESAKFDVPMRVSASHPYSVASAAWNAVRDKANSVREAVRAHEETAAQHMPAEA
jgi:hypothetical protein